MIVVFPGSFDPVTYGHLDIIERSARLADKLIVGVLNNSFKKPLFTPEERVEQLKYLTREIKNIEIKLFFGLLLDFVRENNANAIIRGIRFNMPEYEMQMALGNKLFADDIETLFIPSKPEYMYLSSSMVKEVAGHGGNVSGMIPGEYIKDLMERVKP